MADSGLRIVVGEVGGSHGGLNHGRWLMEGVVVDRTTVVAHALEDGVPTPIALEVQDYERKTKEKDYERKGKFTKTA